MIVRFLMAVIVPMTRMCVFCVARRLGGAVLYRAATWAWWLLLAAMIVGGQVYADVTWWWECRRRG